MSFLFCCFCPPSYWTDCLVLDIPQMRSKPVCTQKALILLKKQKRAKINRLKKRNTWESKQAINLTGRAPGTVAVRLFPFCLRCHDHNLKAAVATPSTKTCSVASKDDVKVLQFPLALSVNILTLKILAKPGDLKPIANAWEQREQHSGLGFPSSWGEEKACSDFGAMLRKRLRKSKEASMNFHVREDSEINTLAQMNGAIHFGRMWVGRGWDLTDLPDFVKVMQNSYSVHPTALASLFHGREVLMRHLPRLSVALPLQVQWCLLSFITSSEADDFFFTDIPPDLLVSGLLSLTLSLDLQAQSSTPTH